MWPPPFLLDLQSGIAGIFHSEVDGDPGWLLDIVVNHSQETLVP